MVIYLGVFLTNGSIITPMPFECENTLGELAFLLCGRGSDNPYCLGIRIQLRKTMTAGFKDWDREF